MHGTEQRATAARAGLWRGDAAVDGGQVLRVVLDMRHGTLLCAENRKKRLLALDAR